ncbi:hypothetical protein HMPREF2626_01410 [Aerococcus sp. HMSC062A02]|nr:hypothetical protein HMPREF2626_01410 [Aerococcus sp. HMSC062A02]
MKRKNIRISRIVFEKTVLHSYFLLPLVSSLVYYLFFNFPLEEIGPFLSNILNVQLSFLGILLTLFGLITALPDTNFTKLLQKYGHNKLVSRTLLLGVISSLVSILCSLFEFLNAIQTYLFIVTFSETLILSIWLYKVTKYIYGKAETKHSQ